MRILFNSSGCLSSVNIILFSLKITSQIRMNFDPNDKYGKCQIKESLQQMASYYLLNKQSAAIVNVGVA